MPTLQEISERSVALAERTIAESRALDYAWMADQKAIIRGQPVHHLDDFIDRQYQELLGELYGDS